MEALRLSKTCTVLKCLHFKAPKIKAKIHNSFQFLVENGIV